MRPHAGAPDTPPSRGHHRPAWPPLRGRERRALPLQARLTGPGLLAPRPPHDPEELQESRRRPRLAGRHKDRPAEGHHARPDAHDARGGRRGLARRREVRRRPHPLGLPLQALGPALRVARPEEARALIAAVPQGDRALWATALYAGLRRGELQALRWSDVDFDRGLIRVERSWDEQAGPIAPKSRAGRRRVPLAGPLRAELAAQRLRQAATGEALVFVGLRKGAFSAEALLKR